MNLLSVLLRRFFSTDRSSIFLTSSVSRQLNLFRIAINRWFGIVAGLQLRSIEEPAGAGGAGAGGGGPAPACYDAECARTEAWLDENQDFVHDYFLRLVLIL